MVGDGGIELEMVSKGFCHEMRGIDLSPTRIELANSIIPENLKNRIEFHVENAEKDLIGSDYDVVLFTHALRHIFDLEAMASAIRDKIMKPTGILVLEEYIGPIRFQFPQERRQAIASFLKDIENKYPHKVKFLRQNPLWDGTKFYVPNPELSEKDDPTCSETIRSSEIVNVLGNYFSLVENINLGGSFFQWIFQNAYNSLKDDDGQKIVESMLEFEMEAISKGDVSSDYVFQVWENSHENPALPHLD